MAARKLQTEIDRTLKKVTEGVELFESIYEKMQASTNQTQKEKLETDLKTQIKKLQRLRDQIKTWVASNDIKDKTALLDNRRLIETQMEKFKACEKEMKTKAFSKEGLIASAKLDPKAQEKLEVTHWVQTKVEELQQQVEQAEAEVESLQAGGKKKKANAAAERLEMLERTNERRKWHISRLEIMLRLMDNGSLKADKVKEVQEDVAYFVENNSDEDFDEDDGIYDDFNLDEQEDLWGIAADNEDAGTTDSEDDSEDLPPRTPSKKHDDEPASNHKREQREPPASPLLKKVPARKTSTAAESKPPPSLNFSTPISSIVKAGLPPAPRPPAPLPPIRYSAAAAAAVTPTPAVAPAMTRTRSESVAAPHPHPLVPVPRAPSISASGSTPSAVDPSSSPSLTHPSVTSPMLSSAAPASSPPDSPAMSEAPSGPSAAASPEHRNAGGAFPSPDVLPTDDSPRNAPNGTSASPAPAPSLPHQLTQEPPPGLPASPLPQPSAMVTPAQPAFPPGVKVPADQVAVAPPQQQQGTAAPGRPTSTAPAAAQQPVSRASVFPGSLSDLVQSFENVKQKAAHRMSNLDQVQKMLESGQSTAPQPQDTDKPRYYVPRNPFQTPSYYPQTPNPIVGTTGIFQQLDVETLFYVFYYNPGTYQQFLAAKELKKQSWRFHTKYLTWFQRHSEPQAITDEYEQGVYVYFDWEGSWCQRKKADFRFEYRYLSEE